MSECKGKSRVANSRRLSTDYCADLKTSDDSKYLCKFDSNKNICDEFEITCEDMEMTNSRRRLSGDLNQEYCKSLKTSEDFYYKCVYDSDNEGCTVEVKNCNEVKVLSTRRLSSDILSDEDCEDFVTSNNRKICVAKSDGSGCEEINGSNEINLSFLLFCLFLFL